MMTDQDRALIELLRVEMTGKLDRLLDGQSVQGKKLDDHEDRIRGVERWKYALPLALVLTAASIVGSAIAAQ